CLSERNCNSNWFPFLFLLFIGFFFILLPKHRCEVMTATPMKFVDRKGLNCCSGNKPCLWVVSCNVKNLFPFTKRQVPEFILVGFIKGNYTLLGTCFNKRS